MTTLTKAEDLEDMFSKLDEHIEDDLRKELEGSSTEELLEELIEMTQVTARLKVVDQLRDLADEEREEQIQYKKYYWAICGALLCASTFYFLGG